MVQFYLLNFKFANYTLKYKVLNVGDLLAVDYFHNDVSVLLLE